MINKELLSFDPPPCGMCGGAYSANGSACCAMWPLCGRWLGLWAARWGPGWLLAHGPRRLLSA